MSKIVSLATAHRRCSGTPRNHRLYRTLGPFAILPAISAQSLRNRRLGLSPSAWAAKCDPSVEVINVDAGANFHISGDAAIDMFVEAAASFNMVFPRTTLAALDQKDAAAAQPHLLGAN